MKDVPLDRADLVKRLRTLADRLHPGIDSVGKPETLKLSVEAAEEIERLRNALHDAYDKIALYHQASGAEYPGGVPNTVLLPQIRFLLGIRK